ncbi:hypothetical protein ACFPM1_02780 [Halorubrum rubrum]|uniref:Uncharacterized protein n=1 Tax=Halorubrum rubrum TaxID=1126240 RepID=A0ABD5QYL4_9EURY|nr:hypothetical protein [Halorubrum rubrum]
MTDLNRIKEASDYLKSTHILLGLSTAGMILIGYTYYYQSPEKLQAVSTVVLVAITAWYAYQLRETVEETRRGRERGAIIRIISDGIDPMLSIIERHDSTDSNYDSDDLEPLPDYSWKDPSSETRGPLVVNLGGPSIPINEPIRKDLERDSSEIIKLCEDYRDIYKEYSDVRSDVKNGIEKYIRDNFIDDKEDWIESLDGRPEDQKYAIRQRYNQYADLVIQQAWERRMEISENKAYFESIREIYDEELAKLQDIRSDLIEKREEVRRLLNDQRQQYISTYHIREIQLEDDVDDT